MRQPYRCDICRSQLAGGRKRHEATTYHRINVLIQELELKGFVRVAVYYEPFLAKGVGEYHQTRYPSNEGNSKNYGYELWAPMQVVEAAAQARQRDIEAKEARVEDLKARGLVATYLGIRKYVPKHVRVQVPELGEKVWAPADVVAAAERARDVELALARPERMHYSPEIRRHAW